MDDGKMRGYVFFLKIFKFSVWRVNKDADTQLLRFDTHLFFRFIFFFTPKVKLYYLPSRN